MVRTLPLPSRRSQPTRHGGQVEAELQGNVKYMGLCVVGVRSSHLAVMGKVRKGIQRGGGFCSRSGSGPRECCKERVEMNFPAEGTHCCAVLP